MKTVHVLWIVLTTKTRSRTWDDNVPWFTVLEPFEVTWRAPHLYALFLITFLTPLTGTIYSTVFIPLAIFLSAVDLIDDVSLMVQWTVH